MQLKKFQKIDLLSDNPNSWIHEYLPNLLEVLTRFGDHVRVFTKASEIAEGDILFILSCDRIIKQRDLNKHKNNIVIHAADLPTGKGWSPWTWQIEEEQNRIVLTLFEAVERLDSGDWYIKDAIDLNGSELINEIRQKIIFKEIAMIEKYLSQYPMSPHPQEGVETFYNKRTERDQELDVNKSIAEQFNKMRVCDNERYPLHFKFRNTKYILKIYKV